MIKLPYEYKGLFGVIYEIVGWNGRVLITKSRGKRFFLNRLDSLMLLELLQLKEEDIPLEVLC